MTKCKLESYLYYELNTNTNGNKSYDLVRNYPSNIDLNRFEFLCIFDHQENKSNNKFNTDKYVRFSDNETDPLFINNGFPPNERVTRTKDKKHLIIFRFFENSFESFVIPQKGKNYKQTLNDYLSGKYDDEINKFRNAAIPYIKKGE